MASEKPAEKAASKRSMVEDETGQRRPFMRGILVHSLMSRGAGFDEAYRAAALVRDRVRGRESVKRVEIARWVEELFEKGQLDRVPLPLPRSIVVTGSGGEAPFSKGVLAQSLLAAAVEADDAFEVARGIEADLVSRAVVEVPRDELRELTHRTLGEKLGERAAERYRVWRAFEADDRPLLLLLGGAAGVGKTALGQEVAHRLGISRTGSTDHIRQIMRIMLSAELMPAIHASSYDAHLRMPDLPGDEDPVVAGFLAQASTVAVGVQAMLDRAVEENTSMILDGVSVLPGLIDLDRYADSAHVIQLVVATLDESAFRERFARRARKSRRPPHRYLENLDSILRIQDYLLELAEQHRIPIVDNSSFSASVLSILRSVNETLRKQTSTGDLPDSEG